MKINKQLVKKYFPLLKLMASQKILFISDSYNEIRVIISETTGKEVPGPTGVLSEEGLNELDKGGFLQEVQIGLTTYYTLSSDILEHLSVYYCHWVDALRDIVVDGKLVHNIKTSECVLFGGSSGSYGIVTEDVLKALKDSKFIETNSVTPEDMPKIIYKATSLGCQTLAHVQYLPSFYDSYVSTLKLDNKGG